MLRLSKLLLALTLALAGHRVPAAAGVGADPAAPLDSRSAQSATTWASRADVPSAAHAEAGLEELEEEQEHEGSDDTQRWTAVATSVRAPRRHDSSGSHPRRGPPTRTPRGPPGAPRGRV